MYNPSHSPIHKLTTTMSDFFNKNWPTIIDNPFEPLPLAPARPKEKVREFTDGSSEPKASFSFKQQTDRPLSLEEKRALADLVRSRLFLNRLGARIRTKGQGNR